MLSHSSTSARLAVLLARAAIGITLCLSCRSAVAGERGSPRTSSLSWVRLAGAEDCVSTQDLARDVETRLRRPVFVSPAQADVSVEGHIARRGSGLGWDATLLVRDAAGALLGTRELHHEGRSCTDLREPLALVVAVMIDPDAALGENRAADAAPERTAVVPAAAAEKERPVVVQTPLPAPPEPRWRFDGGASVIAGLGLLPSAGLGVYAGGILDPPQFLPLQGFGAAWLDSTADADGPGRATFSLLFLGGGVCPLTRRGSRVSAYACANGHLGLLTSRGEGIAMPRSDTKNLYLAGALEGRLSVRVFGPIALRGALSVAVPVLRDTVAYRRADGTSSEVFRMAPVVGTADLGFGVVLP